MLRQSRYDIWQQPNGPKDGDVRLDHQRGMPASQTAADDNSPEGDDPTSRASTDELNPFANLGRGPAEWLRQTMSSVPTPLPTHREPRNRPGSENDAELPHLSTTDTERVCRPTGPGDGAHPRGDDRS